MSATAELQENVVRLSIESPDGRYKLTLEMSLQRHHYCYCARADALAINSLFFSKVSTAQVLADCKEVATSIERLLGNHWRAEAMFGVKFKAKSGRSFMVDNSQLNPKGYPNHFFVVEGPDVWPAMTQNEYIAARDIRRVEEEIGRKSDSSKYLDPKVLTRLTNTPEEATNPVLRAYRAARGSFNAVPGIDQKLCACSGRPDIVANVGGIDWTR